MDTVCQVTKFDIIKSSDGEIISWARHMCECVMNSWEPLDLRFYVDPILIQRLSWIRHTYDGLME